jgi:hypothetical protein
MSDFTVKTFASQVVFPWFIRVVKTACYCEG